MVHKEWVRATDSHDRGFTVAMKKSVGQRLAPHFCYALGLERQAISKTFIKQIEAHFQDYAKDKGERSAEFTLIQELREMGDKRVKSKA